MPAAALMAPGPQAVGSTSDAGSTRVPDPVSQCGAFIDFPALTVDLRLPLLCGIRTEPAASLQQWDEAWALGTARGLAGGLEYGVACACYWSQLAAPLPENAAALQHGKQQQRPTLSELMPYERALLWWQLLALAWVLSAAAAGA